MLVEILEEDGLLRAERLADEVAQTGVALVEPATRRDYALVRNDTS